MTHARYSMLVLLAACALACRPDGEPTDTPTEEELEAARQGFCELEIECGQGQAFASLDECLEHQVMVYSYNETCEDLYFQRDTCLAELPDCDAYSGNVEHKHPPCGQKVMAASAETCVFPGTPLDD